MSAIRLDGRIARDADGGEAEREEDSGSSHRNYLLISFRKSTPSQNRQLIANYYE